MTRQKTNLLIIGGGLIGSSLARALRRTGADYYIEILENNALHLDQLKELKIADKISSSLQNSVPKAQIIILATPIGAIKSIAKTLRPLIQDRPIISDVGSVKRSIFNTLTQYLGDISDIVPAHPIAGTEKSGPAAGLANLFEDRWCILTPGKDTRPDAIEEIKKIWHQAGSQTQIMDAQHHDLVLAVTSHLPHLIAFNIVGTAADLEEVTRSEVIKYSASGFRDFTRIAASDPIMWRDIFLHNKDAILEALGRFSEDLSSLQRAIRWQEGDKLETLFRKTRTIRREVIDQGQDVDAPDFGRLSGEQD